MNNNEMFVTTMANGTPETSVSSSIFPQSSEEYNRLVGMLEESRDKILEHPDKFFRIRETGKVTLFDPVDVFKKPLLGALDIEEEMVLEWGVDGEFIFIQYVTEFYDGGETSNTMNLTWEEAIDLCQN